MNRTLPIREYPTVTPFLMCSRVAKVIDFLERAFDAVEIDRIVDAHGRVLHAVLHVGDTKVMMGEPPPSMKRLKPKPSNHYVFVTNVRRSYARAILAGGTSFSKPVGPRLGAVTDPGGNLWWIAKEEVASPEVIRRRNQVYVRKRAKK